MKIWNYYEKLLALTHTQCLFKGIKQYAHNKTVLCSQTLLLQHARQLNSNMGAPELTTFLGDSLGSTGVH